VPSGSEAFDTVYPALGSHIPFRTCSPTWGPNQRRRLHGGRWSSTNGRARAVRRRRCGLGIGPN
jgi:hypothetical protein